MRSTAPQLTRQSKLAEVIEGITGRELTAKELQGGFDLDELLDAACNILVLQSREQDRRGLYSNVERVFQTHDHLRKPLQVTRPQQQPKGQQCQRGERCQSGKPRNVKGKPPSMQTDMDNLMRHSIRYMGA
jgi:hypothetical protein